MPKRERKRVPVVALSRAIRARVRRRAYELSKGVYERLVEHMDRMVAAGALNAADIEVWEPEAKNG